LFKMTTGITFHWSTSCLTRPIQSGQAFCHRLVLCTGPAVSIENGSDVHGRPWTNSKISLHTAGYDCSVFLPRKI